MVSIPEGILNRPPPQIPLGLPSTLIERRPDVAATERAMAEANEQIGISKAAFFPMLTLGGTGGFVSTSLATLFTVPSLFWSVGPQLAATLFDGGLRKGQLHLSKDAYDASVAIYRQTVLTAFQQVEDQLSSLRILEQEQSAGGIRPSCLRSSRPRDPRPLRATRYRWTRRPSREILHSRPQP